MKLPRARFTIQRLMIAVALTAWVLSDRSSVTQIPSPRSLVPMVTTAYLAWALFDAFKTAHAIAPRVLFVLPALICLLAGAESYQRRVAHFRGMAAYHRGQARLCKWSAEGRSGVLYYCGSGGCYREEIPRAANALERANMLRAADDHARLQAKYERAASRPWLSIDP